MTLAQTQELFWQLVRKEHPRGLEAATPTLKGTPDLSAAERAEIYSNMYWWRQVDALREDFPQLLALLGDDDFYHTAEAYLEAYPSEHPSIAELGRKLSAFLREHAERADLGDLAELEWARTRVFFEAAVQPATSDALAALGEGAGLARFSFVPALRVLTLEHSADALWRALQDGEATPDPVRASETLVVWRKEFEVFHVALVAAEAAALDRARAGATLAEVCECFAEEAEPVQAAFAAIGSWLAEGWIATVKTSE